MQFLGRISFSLYLVHELFTEWAMVDTYYFFIGEEVEPNMAVLYCILIYTPIVILLSWLLTILVDGPAKDFAYNLDVQTRKERPPPPKDAENPEEYYSCLNFTKRSWKVIGFVIWLVVLFTFTELYSAFKPQ